MPQYFYRFYLVVFVLGNVFTSKHCLAQAKNSYHIIFNEAQNHFYLNQLDLAEAKFNQIESIANINQGQCWLFLAQIFDVKKQYNQSQYYLDKIKNANSKVQNLAIFQLLGIHASINNKQIEKAIGYFQKLGVEHSFIWQNIENELVNKNDVALQNLGKLYPSNYFLQQYIKKRTQVLNLNVANEPGLTTLPKIIGTNQIFKVALLLPFELDATKKADKKYLFDFYEGMLQSKQDWELKNKKIEISIFDIGSKSEIFEQLFRNKKFLESNIIIGPLHAETNIWLQEFAQVQKTILVNPFSKNHQWVKNQPYSYLATTSHQNQLLALQQYIVKNYSSKSAIIYNPSDSLAKHFLETYPIYKKDAVVFNAKSLLQNPKINQSENLLWISPDKNTEKWILENQSTLTEKKHWMIFDQYKDFKWPQNLIFTVSNPDYINNNDTNIETFNEAFWQKNKKSPSVFTYKGQDLLHFWAKQYFENYSLFNNGTVFSESNQSLLSGFNYKLKENTNYNTNIIQIQHNQETFLQRISY